MIINPKIIDGKKIAADIRREVAEEVRRLRPKPGLAVILVGDDPASQVYVHMKARACEETGIISHTERLPADISEAELLQIVNRFNRNATYHGLLVQLPLPEQIDSQKIIETVDPAKDVDCFHPANVGRLMLGDPAFEPATPAGIMELLRRTDIQTAGRHVVVVGRSNIVGKPIAMMLAQKKAHANSIVTIAHTAAPDLGVYTRQADILIAAAGRPEMITADMIKEGSVVIDVGVNRVDAPESKRGYRLVGDVAFAEAATKAAAITPVPGGVGPMTIAMLLKNTLKAYQIQQK